MGIGAAVMAIAASTMLNPTVAVAAQLPDVVCTVDDARAHELSGLVTTASGYVAINDGQADSRDVRVFFLDATCAVTRVLGYPTPARDPEDLTTAPDGTLWVADIGDNITASVRRDTIALWQLPADGGEPVIHRLSYPDGPHDAEALIFGSDGAPIVITKEPSGRAGLYRPTDPMRAGMTVRLTRVGEFVTRAVGENNAFGPLGELVVTGAAVAPDRRRVVLRTYTAAYEWDVPDGDLVKAITTTTPRVTSLPDEPQGEAIAYTMDGTAFLTVSDEAGATTLRRYTPSRATLAPRPAETLTTGATTSASTVSPIIPVWAGLTIAGGGLVLVLTGFIGLRRSRQRQAQTPPGTATSPDAPVR